MYLTHGEASARLILRWDIDADLTIGDVMAASEDLDALAPFVGEPTDPDQEHEFPRDGDEFVPEAILDAVALMAYQLASDEQAPAISEGVSSISISYARPNLSQTEKRLQRLLAPYLKRTGRVA